MESNRILLLKTWVISSILLILALLTSEVTSSCKSQFADGAHTCIRNDLSQIMCWGSNEYGQLGYGHNSTLGASPNEMGEYLSLVNVGSGLEIASLYSGLFFIYLLTKFNIYYIIFHNLISDIYC